MRTALGHPLHEISSNVLNKIVTKDVQMNLRKYKMNAGQGGNRDANRVRFEGSSPVRADEYEEDDV